MPKTLFLFLFLAILAPLASAQPADRPNILFIMVDDLGYGDLSCQGAPDLKTPHIDGLMAAGARLSQFYANCPVCSPTRASLLTGLYPDKAGVPGVIRTSLPGQETNWGNLRDDVKTLPAHLAEAGYDTAIFGKWHLGLDKPDRPRDKGFDHFEGFLGDMMDDYSTHTRHGNHYMYRNEEAIRPEGHATDLFTDWAIRYIHSRRGATRPFFAYLAYNAPHTPIQPPAAWLEKVTRREAGLTEARARLVALIEHLDDGIGRVLQCLKDEKFWENTIVVFTSDNGGQTDVGARNAPWRGAKQDLWEGGIRVATCLTWPARIKAGSAFPNHVSLTMDLYPTLAELAGHPVTHAIDGRSFAPLLLGEEWKETERDLYWVRLEGGPRYGGIPYHAARRGDWKLLRNTGFEPYQLFHLAADPGEEKPVPRSQAPKVYDELQRSLLRRIYQSGQFAWQRENP